LYNNVNISLHVNMDESAYSTLLKYVENTEYKDTENLTESETRGSQEPVIVHLVFNLTSNVDRKWGCYT
jgi:hypothetical protein